MRIFFFLEPFSFVCVEVFFWFVLWTDAVGRVRKVSCGEGGEEVVCDALWHDVMDHPVSCPDTPLMGKEGAGRATCCMGGADSPASSRCSAVFRWGGWGARSHKKRDCAKTRLASWVQVGLERERGFAFILLVVFLKRERKEEKKGGRTGLEAFPPPAQREKDACHAMPVH